ncbi:MAG TPA: squalene synthase HpnC [Streptosporangiaceae bacterium]|jgi:squalene synthase HpnC
MGTVTLEGTQMREELARGQDAAAVAAAMAARASGENFPVALRMLPASQRHHLMAVYGFARMTDDTGDEAPPAERLGLLDEIAADLALVEDGRARLPAVRALRPVIAECGVPVQLFADLIQANRQDQCVSRYQSFDDLVGYCKLSANPVGRIVLYVFGAYSARRAELSDRVCTALQLAEHWQDIAEDCRAGRIYLPQDDLTAFGCTEPELAAAAAGPQLRALVEFEVRRARTIIDSGAPLVGTLRGFARLAVAGYVAGGRAALAAISAAGHDVLGGPPAPRKPRLAAELLRAYVTGR